MDQYELIDSRCDCMISYDTIQIELEVDFLQVAMTSLQMEIYEILGFY